MYTGIQDKDVVYAALNYLSLIPGPKVSSGIAQKRPAKPSARGRMSQAGGKGTLNVWPSNTSGHGYGIKPTLITASRDEGIIPYF